MLRAIDSSSGEIVILHALPLSEIKRLKRTGSFICPKCHEPVYARSGSRMVAHFAHHPKSRCNEKNGGEGEYHETGKWLIYESLKREGYQVLLEPYLKTLQQRPDMLLHYQNTWMAIEFQCARIPIRDIAYRTKNYQKKGIHPLWVIGANQLKRKGRELLQVSDFHKYMIHYHRQAYALYFFDPTLCSWITARSLWSNGERYVNANLEIMKMNSSFRFIHLFGTSPAVPHLTASSWLHYMTRQRRTYSPRTSSQELQWRQFLYLRNLHFSLIPSESMIPLKSQLFLPSRLKIWQSRFIIDVFSPTPIHQKIQTSTIPTPFTSPLLDHVTPNPAEEYLDLLEKLNFVKKGKDNHYYKLKEIAYPKGREEAEKRDRALVTQLLKM
ncbi:competence protein CoiA [Thalassobacillus sp. CUG 92003]|uniref:competence protein CoiA n=1 Tax=Thalassobacillus sp. CUG 92003 TaxID=2736641 RepID=UPI0015E76118|nr:competence protein CoiA family protein [Thalassobacillus sp. CUG 92003]